MKKPVITIDFQVCRPQIRHLARHVSDTRSISGPADALRAYRIYDTAKNDRIYIIVSDTRTIRSPGRYNTGRIENRIRGRLIGYAASYQIRLAYDMRIVQLCL